MGFHGNLNWFIASRISELCKFIWVFMIGLLTHLLEYQCLLYYANLDGFSWQFLCGFEHQKYCSVYYESLHFHSNFNGF